VNCSCSYLNQQQKTVHIDKKKNISKGGKWCGVGERTLRSPERVDSFFLIRYCVTEPLKPHVELKGKQKVHSSFLLQFVPRV
jgi:hypothetical protein